MILETDNAELMDLPTVEVRGERSQGLPRGKMIVKDVENKANFVLDSVIHRASMSVAMDTTIQFRASSKLRKELEKLARQDRRKLGDYIRLLCERAAAESISVNDSRPKATVA